MEAYSYALDAETRKELWRVNLGKKMLTMPSAGGIFTYVLK